MPVISLSGGERRPRLEQGGCHQTRPHEQGRFAAEQQICSRAETLAAWSGLCQALKHPAGPGGAVGSCWGGGRVGGLIKPFRRSVGGGCERCSAETQDKRGPSLRNGAVQLISSRRKGQYFVPVAKGDCRAVFEQWSWGAA